MQHDKYCRLYIDGEWRDGASGQRVTFTNPALEASAGELAFGDASDVDRAALAARRAFASFSKTSTEERMALLDRILTLLDERAEQFAQAMVAEMGVAITFARQSQVPFAAAHIRVQRDLLKDFQFLTLNGTTATAKEPIGVCALITPWNWPLYQITAKVAPALAAGCTVILKPSELSPLSAELFAQVMDDAGTPPGVFNLVHGSGEVVGHALSTHREVDMVSITGSTRAGVLVAQAAAPTVKRVVQELGGKSPNVFLPDADFAEAVAKGIMSGMRNVGQSCSAPTRMVVPAERLDEVAQLAAAAVAQIKVGDPLDPDTTLGPIANEAQFRRVQEMIQAGIDDGATLVCGGLGRPEGLDTGFFVRPTVFAGVTPSMRIAQEEIFGPVVAIMAYEDEAQALEIANDTIYGLGSHVQSRDHERACRFAAGIRAGQVHINYPAWDGMAAFGGYKQSGNGREYGRFGLDEFLEVKSIVGYAKSQ